MAARLLLVYCINLRATGFQKIVISDVSSSEGEDSEQCSKNNYIAIQHCMYLMLVYQIIDYHPDEG